MTENQEKRDIAEEVGGPGECDKSYRNFYELQNLFEKKQPKFFGMSIGRIPHFNIIRKIY